MSKLLSVIIPAYNAHRWIKTCLDSVYRELKAGEIESFEIIISDDNSDRSYEYLLNEYNNIKLIVNDHNEGAGVARQKGLDIATGKWVAFVDTDDIIKNDPFSILHTTDESINIVIYDLYYEKNDKIADDPMKNSVLHGKIYKREFIESNDIRFDPFLRIGEDCYFVEICDRIAKEDSKLFLDKVCYVLTYNKESTTHNCLNDWLLFSISTLNYQEAILRSRYRYLFTDEEICRQLEYRLADNTYNTSNKDNYGLFYKIMRLSENYDISLFKSCHSYGYADNKIKKLFEHYQANKNRKYLMSIIIPMYNSVPYIENCLTDLYKKLGQFGKYTQIICVDDYSPDGYGYQYIMEKFVDKTNLFFYFYKENVRMGMNRNRGLELAEGEWVTFLDHDDFFKENTFKNFFAVVKKFRDVKIVRGFPNDVCTIELIHGIFYKRSFLEENHLRFSDKLNTSEDTYFNRLCFLTAEKRYGKNAIVKAKEVKYCYTFSKSSTMNKEYNGRVYTEEFLLEYINAVIMSIYKADIPKKDARLLLINLAITVDQGILEYKNTSKNFKKYNIKLLCGIFMILEREFDVGLESWYYFTSKNTLAYNKVYSKWYKQQPNFTITTSLSFLNLCIQMIKNMSKNERIDIIDICKNGMKGKVKDV